MPPANDKVTPLNTDQDAASAAAAAVGSVHQPALYILLIINYHIIITLQTVSHTVMC